MSMMLIPLAMALVGRAFIAKASGLWSTAWSRLRRRKPPEIIGSFWRSGRLLYRLSDGRLLPAIMGGAKTTRTPFTRLFTIEDRAGPENVPQYQGRGRAMAPSWAFGDLTPIREPDPNRYGAFKIIDTIRGEKGLPTLPIEVRHQFTLSEMLRLARKGCPLDLQVHYGECQDPRDFNGGWNKVLTVEGIVITNWSTDALGALNQGDDAVVNESVDTTGLDMYEITQLAVSALAASEVVREILDVAICDAVTCGACGLPSDGCKKFFAISTTTAGSPGLAADLIYSDDGGATIGSTNIATLTGAEDPDEVACVGTHLVVVSQDSGSLHYALITEILLGTETWTEVTTGFTAPAGSPRAIFSMGSRFTWIVGAGGYVYFSDDITAGVDVQDAGVQTAQPLNAIHGYDELELVAVGNSNAVIVTHNGGSTWSSITGPAGGVNLNSVFMKSKEEWFIGTNGGRLFYTRDGGDTWTEKAFPGSGAGVVRDIVFATPTVGYMAHDTAAPAGRILRTIDGGFSWYVLQEDGGNIPANDRINAIAACAENVNVLYAGGLADDATDGILVKGA